MFSCLVHGWTSHGEMCPACVRVDIVTTGDTLIISYPMTPPAKFRFTKEMFADMEVTRADTSEKDWISVPAFIRQGIADRANEILDAEVERCAVVYGGEPVCKGIWGEGKPSIGDTHQARLWGIAPIVADAALGSEEPKSERDYE